MAGDSRPLQVALAVLSCTAFYLATSRNPAAQLPAALVGILAQACWIRALDWRRQWGMGILTLLYLARYIGMLFGR